MRWRDRWGVIGLLELPGHLLRSPEWAGLGVVTLVLGGLISGSALLRLGLDDRYRVGPGALVAAGVCWAGVALACRWPRLGLVLVYVGVNTFALLGLPITPLWLGLLAGLFFVGLLRPTGEAFAVTVGSVAVGLLLAYRFETVPFTWTTVSQLGWLFAAGAAGSVARTQRRYAAEALGRAIWAERTREQEARHRADDERLRIARELHDVVGHSIALINIQAGVAAHVIDTDPGAARAALEQVADTASAALHEMRGTLGLLRGDVERGEDEAPPPPVGDITTLVADARAAGLPVELTIEGQAPAVTAVLRTTVYRVVQECLTNVVKHAARATLVRVGLRYGPRTVDIEVINDGASRSTSDGAVGRGLQGMCERVRALGGEVRAGPEPGDRFAVRAVLPLRVTP